MKKEIEYLSDKKLIELTKKARFTQTAIALEVKYNRSKLSFYFNKGIFPPFFRQKIEKFIKKHNLY